MAFELAYQLKSKNIGEEATKAECSAAALDKKYQNVDDTSEQFVQKYHKDSNEPDSDLNQIGISYCCLHYSVSSIMLYSTTTKSYPYDSYRSNLSMRVFTFTSLFDATLAEGDTLASFR